MADAIEASIVIAATPAEIFAVYRDVPGWSAWDPDTRRASLDGPFALGTTGELVPTKGRRVTMQIVALEPDRLFTVEARIPLFRMRFEHRLEPVHAGTRAWHRVEFSGALAFLFGPLVGGPLHDGLPATLRGLKRHVEARVAPGRSAA